MEVRVAASARGEWCGWAVEVAGSLVGTGVVRGTPYTATITALESVDATGFTLVTADEVLAKTVSGVWKAKMHRARVLALAARAVGTRLVYRDALDDLRQHARDRLRREHAQPVQEFGPGGAK